MLSRDEILKQARSARIPFGAFEGRSILDAAENNPEHLRFLLGHKYALDFHPWLRKLIIRTLAVKGESFTPATKEER